MDTKALKKNYIKSKGTRGYKVFTTSLFIFLVTQIVSYISIFYSAYLIVSTKDIVNTHIDDFVVEIYYAFGYLYIFLIIINFAYIKQAFKREKIYRKSKRNPDRIIVGKIIRIDTLKSGTKYARIQYDDKCEPFQIIDKNAYGKRKKSSYAIAIWYEGVHWISYL